MQEHIELNVARAAPKMSLYLQPSSRAGNTQVTSATPINRSRAPAPCGNLEQSVRLRGAQPQASAFRRILWACLAGLGAHAPRG
jgi:hypothetical protein